MTKRVGRRKPYTLLGLLERNLLLRNLVLKLGVSLFSSASDLQEHRVSAIEI